MTTTEADEVEQQTSLRIKFAALDSRGSPVGDAGNPEYVGFFTDLPPGWTRTEIGLINTRTEYQRPAMLVSDGVNRVIAVEHETGLEILLVGVLTGVVTEALIGLAKWGWKRWKARRSGLPNKQAVSFVIELPRSGSAEALTNPTMRLTLQPPVTDEEIARYLRLASQITASD